MLVLFTGTDPKENDGWSSLNKSGEDIGVGWSLRGTSSSPTSRVDADTSRASESPKVNAPTDRSMPSISLPSMGQSAKCCKEIWISATCSWRGTRQRPAIPFWVKPDSHDSNCERTLTRMNSVVKTVGFTVRTRLNRSTT